MLSSITGVVSATPTYLFTSRSLGCMLRHTLAPWLTTFAWSRGELLIAMGAVMAVGLLKYVSMAFSFRYEMKG